MMDNIQNIIADRHYVGALENQDGPLKPHQAIPKPSKEQITEVGNRRFTLSDVLDSPIGVFEFKKYARQYTSFQYIIEFLVRFEKLKSIESPEHAIIVDLYNITQSLPALYANEITAIKRNKKKLFPDISEDETSPNANKTNVLGNLTMRNKQNRLSVGDRISILSGSKRDRFKNNNNVSGIGLDGMQLGAAGSFRDLTSSFAYVGLNNKRNQMAAGPLSVVDESVGLELLIPSKDAIAPGNGLGFLESKFPAGSAFPSSHAANKGFASLTESEEHTEDMPPIMHKLKSHISLEREGKVRAVAGAVEAVNDAEADFEDKQMVAQKMVNEFRSEMKHEAMKVFSPLAQLLEAKAEDLLKTFADKQCEQYIEMLNLIWYSEQSLKITDFILFRDLGRGAFGVVSSAKTKTTGTLCAIKCLNKRLIKGKNAVKLVAVEKSILETLGNSPSDFTIWLKYSFSDKDYFYMALPLCTGGDLGFHLKKKGYLELDRAKFHLAEILEGLNHMHNLKIVYRDLKPENIIFDVDGHCRISDMGLATHTNDKKIRGKAGTPGYWAPEVVSRQPYSYSADYWSLGCVLFEMLVGLCPFSSTNTGMERDQATLEWEIEFPDVIGREDKPETLTPFPELAKPLILGLLDRDKQTRFGPEDVRSSKLFADLDWEMLRRRELTPPWRPRKGKIHAANQVDLDFQNNDAKYKRIKLLPEDEISNFDYTSIYAHQLDIVAVLTQQDQTGTIQYEDQVDNACCCPV